MQRSRERLEVASDESEHEGQRQRAVDEQIAVAFDVATVLGVEMDSVGVPREGGVAEEEGGRGCEGVRELGVPRCYSPSASARG